MTKRSLPVPVAQWIARWTSNPEVVGSNPTGDALLDQIYKNVSVVSVDTDAEIL